MNLAITSSSFSKNKALISKLKKNWTGEIKINSEGIRFSEQELISFLESSEAAIIGLDEISEDVLNSLPKLKFLVKYGVGLDNINTEMCKQRGIQIGWTGGVNKLSVAEMTLGFALTLSRNLYQSSIELSSGVWKKDGGSLLSNKTIGIIGFGYIGKEVYRLLSPFNCKIMVNDTDQSAIEGYSITSTSKEAIYEECDIITIHTPLTSKTNSLISKKEFALMRKSPILINTARGGIVNEKDVIQALQDHQIKAFAIDAYTTEPNPPNELVSRNDVFCTPHIGGNAKEAVMAMGLTAIENLIKLVNLK